MKVSPTIVVLFVLLSLLISSASSHYGESCNIHSDCSSDSDILVNSDSDIGTTTNEMCINGRCACTTLALWDPTAKQCVSRVGSFCNSNWKCVRNSKCQLSKKNKNLGKCICEEKGFFTTNFKLCMKGNGTFDNYSDSDDYTERKTLISSADEDRGYYKKPCTKNDDCLNPDIRLKCSNQICSCHGHEIYDKNFKKCLAIPGNFCSPPKDLCVENSTCQISRHLAHMKKGSCVCDTGFDISSDGKKCVVFAKNSNQKQTQKINEQNSGKVLEPCYLGVGFVRWSLATIFFIISIALTVFLASWAKNCYKNH